MRHKDYLLPLKPLLELHAELLWRVCPGPHHAGSGMHILHWEIVLLVHLIHHRGKGRLLALHGGKTPWHCRSLSLVGLAIHGRLLVDHYSSFLAMKRFLLGFQSLSL